jgi:hypothetical protein
MRTRKGMVRTVNKSLIRSRWAAIGAAVAVTLGGGTFMVANAADAPDLLFTAITPCRLLDTRSDVVPVETSKVENFGVRKGLVQDKTKGNTVNNDITVIFDKDATNNASNNFTLQYGNTDFRPILGDCDAQFEGSGDLVGVVPSALLLNVTTVNMSANGFVTVYPWQSLGVPTGTSVTLRPIYSNLNPISSLPSVSNNVTVMLATVDLSTYIPGVKCSGGSHSAETSPGSGTWSGSDCGGLDGFRVYNENGNTHVIIDVLGYYDGGV